VNRGDMRELCEELGDVLLQVVFHARMAAERGDFDIIDVADGVSRKMILRHPHIFGDATADTADAVVKNWEAIKKQEKGQDTETGMMRQVPQALPAIMRSMKVQSKAARVGFDWADVWGAYEKLEEEVRELREAIGGELGDEKLAEEFGDVLFAAVNVARFIKVHPEFALKGTVEKFIRRFEHVEKRAKEAGRRLETMTLDEMDVFWNEAKALE
jgi:tetrapyrrole methylase family protein/MazG family protein